MGGFDIIGDVHGCASMLVERLIGMGYTRRGGEGAFSHPVYHAVFVGDLIDRGPQQLETLQLVKAMVDAGSASIVMGNHEFNAVAYATEHPELPGYFLRPHTAKNTRQHQAFLDQLTPSQQRYYIDWFRTWPLWLTLPHPTDSGAVGSARVVHACWHEESLRTVENACDGQNRINTTDQWILANDRESALYHAVEVLLKGPELDLRPYGIDEFRDKDGHPRQRARLCWWKQTTTRLSELTELGDHASVGQGVDVSDDDLSYLYRGNVPVFYGHYWRQNTPVHSDDFTDYTACVDFSAVISRKPVDGAGPPTLVAYRWDGEKTIDEQHYIPHGSAHRADIR